MNSTRWRRVVGSGALWTLVYNLVWGVAWFTFMRHQWEEGVSAIGRAMPWTPEVWFLLVVMTVPIGLVVMTYAAGRPQSMYTGALSAAAAGWFLFTISMGAYSLHQGLPIRVIALDAVVNLVGMIAASIAGAWSQLDVQP